MFFGPLMASSEPEALPGHLLLCEEETAADACVSQTEECVLESV